MGRHGGTKWVCGLARLVGRLHRLHRMQDRSGPEAAVLWSKIRGAVPTYEKRFGAPHLLAGSDQHHTLQDVTDNVLQSTCQHYATCLREYQIEAASSEYQEWRVRLAAHAGCNSTVSSRLKGKRLAQSSSLPVQGRHSFVPGAIFTAVTDYWKPIMEAEDIGYTRAFTDLVDAHVVPGHWEVPPLAAEDLEAAAACFRSGSAPGFDNWHGADLKVLPKPAWEQLAQILNRVESDSHWPDELLHSWTALIPKTEAPMSPNELRPIRVLPTVYRLWSRARLKAIMHHLDP
eukprot:6469926-Amphidinium_carterae.1